MDRMENNKRRNNLTDICKILSNQTRQKESHAGIMAEAYKWEFNWK